MNQPIKLKIALQDLPHKCERTLLIPEVVNMYQVHVLIQRAIGWENAHLFEFSDKRRMPTYRIGIPNDFEDDFQDAFGFTKNIQADKAKLKDVFIVENNAKPFWYLYDFGDGWEHKLSFLKVTQKDMKFYDGIPVCIKAMGKCPPEDVGGPWGYTDFLEAISDKNHPEHAEIKEWYGLEDENYDVNNVDIKDMNLTLKKYFNSKYWNKVDFD